VKTPIPSIADSDSGRVISGIWRNRRLDESEKSPFSSPEVYRSESLKYGDRDFISVLLLKSSP